jgi:tetratricopeptide (TPR) repeat protein
LPRLIGARIAQADFDVVFFLRRRGNLDEVAPSSLNPGRPARQSKFIALAVFALTFVAFVPAISGQFLSWDDSKNFVGNPWYRGLGPDQLQWMWTTTLLGHYVPISWMTLGLDYTLWGMDPRGYHVTNIVIHAANAVLVFFLARRIFALTDDHHSSPTQTDFAAAFAALIFSVHPLRVESVAWITERRDVLSLCFGLSTVLLYLRAIEARERAKRWYGLSVLAFACAVLSKATTVTVPAVLAIMNVYPLRRLGGDAGWTGTLARRVYAELAPFALIGVVAGLGSVAALPLGTQLSGGGKLAVAAYGVVFYLWKTLIPIGLSPLYQLPPHLNAAAPTFIASALAVVALAIAAWLIHRKRPGLVVALAIWFVITLPLLGAVQNGNQIAADRYTYHAAPALALLAGALLLNAERVFRPSLAVGACVLLALSALTWRQTGYWHDSVALWSRALAVDSMSAIAHNDLGIELASAGQTSEAIAQYKTAIALDPNYPHAHNNLGFEFEHLGQIEPALAEYRTAVQIDPKYVEAELNWGNALLSLGKNEEAISHYQRAASLDPKHEGAQFNWGVALMRLGRTSEAVQHFSSAMELDPTDADAQNAWRGAVARLRTETGRPD